MVKVRGVTCLIDERFHNRYIEIIIAIYDENIRISNMGFSPNIGFDVSEQYRIERYFGSIHRKIAWFCRKIGNRYIGGSEKIARYPRKANNR